jgi:hypothetical protein
MRVLSVHVDGPLEKENWVRPQNFDRFFSEDDPKTPEGRKRYAGDVLRKFATRAFRRPVDDRTVDRLVTIAEAVYGQPGKSVEEGVAQAMVAVLASPRFLFRVEDADQRSKGQTHPDVDEYALASRLSYFLWSTMPDEELFRLAGRGELRKNLPAQVRRMLADPRSDMLIENFTGQWLQARDVEGVAVDARVVLARDDGVEKELKKEQEEFRAFLAQREAQAKEARAKGEVPKTKQAFNQIRRGRFPRQFGPPRVELDDALRRQCGARPRRSSARLSAKTGASLTCSTATSLSSTSGSRSFTASRT